VYKPRKLLNVLNFGKHCSCHLQNGSLGEGRVVIKGKMAVRVEWKVSDVIGQAECGANQWGVMTQFRKRSDKIS
jgi:hypothetical protein